MSLKALLKRRPVIYEIVPPRRDTSRYHTELRGVEAVLNDSRIAAINVPELINRREAHGRVAYSPATIPPEEYAMMIKEYKEPIVNVVTPRLGREEFQARAERILHDYRIPNVVLVGKERHQDILPGPGVLDAFHVLHGMREDHTALGGICIFDRQSQATADYGEGSWKLAEHKRVWLKADAGCDFVTSQITFDPKPALEFLASYQALCEKSGKDPLTVFVSLAAVPTPSILSLLDRLDVVIPPKLRKRMLQADDIGRESVNIATEVLLEMAESLERRHIYVPLGLQVEQIGVKSEELALELLDNVYRDFRRS